MDKYPKLKINNRDVTVQDMEAMKTNKKMRDKFIADNQEFIVYCANQVRQKELKNIFSFIKKHFLEEYILKKIKIDTKVEEIILKKKLLDEIFSFDELMRYMELGYINGK